MLDIPEDVKNAYRNENTKKRIRIHFPNGEHDDLLNPDIVEESVQFTESICSADNIKFGLCEASQLSFSTIDIGNIKGCEIEAYNEIYMEDGYNVKKYRGNVLGADAFVLESGSSQNWMFSNPMSGTLKIDFIFPEEGYTRDIDIEINSQTESIHANFYEEHFNDVTYIMIRNNAAYTQNITGISFIRDDDEYIEHFPPCYYPIPLGRFTVDSCKRNDNRFKRDVVAYGKSPNIKIPTFNKTEYYKMSFSLHQNTPYKYDLGIAYLTADKNADPKNFEVISEKTNKYGGRSFYSESLREKNPPHYLVKYLELHGEYDRFLITKEELNDILRISVEKNKQKYESAIQALNEAFAYQDIEWYNPYLNASYSKDTLLNMIKCPVMISWNSYNGSGALTGRDIVMDYNESDIYYFYPSIEMASGCDIVQWEAISNKKQYYYAISVLKKLKISIIERGEIGSSASPQTFFDDSILESYKIEKVKLINNLLTYKITIDRQYNAGWNNYYVDREKIKEINSNLKNIFSSYAEIQGCFGRYDRYNQFKLMNINNNFGLYPSETLYPSEDLYPSGANGGLVDRSRYYSLWYDDYEVKPFGTVVATYKDTNNEEQRLVYQFDPEAENTYYMDDNYILLNSQYTEAQVKELLDTYFIPNIKGISYYPAEITMKGLPYVEAGDVLQILTVDGGFETFMFSRTLSGIQSLTDDVESRGDEVNQSAYAVESEEE